jgi:hypothetical protein
MRPLCVLNIEDLSPAQYFSTKMQNLYLICA